MSKQRTAPDFVDEKDRDKGEQKVHNTNNSNLHSNVGRTAFESCPIEDVRSVVDDRVDTSDLLEDGKSDGDVQRKFSALPR